MEEKEKVQLKSPPDWNWTVCGWMTKEDELDRLVWAVSFIWAGIVVMLAHYHSYPEDQAWTLFFLGAGTLVLSEIVARLVLPAYRTADLGDLIWAAFLFGVGTDRWDWILPFILIAIGWSLLRSARMEV
jgi:hypothetical protein